MKKFTLLYIVPPSPIFAGVERVVHQFATGLAARLSESTNVHVIFCQDYLEPELEAPLYTKHVLNVERLRSMFMPLYRTLQATKPDVIVCAQVEPTVLLWATVLASPTLSPLLIAHLHGNPEIERRNGSRRSRFLFHLFRRIVSKNLSAVISVSPSLRDYASHRLAPSANHYFSRNPVREFPSAHDRDRRIRSSAFKYISVGRSTEQKGFDILLQAIALVRCSLEGATFTIVGSGPDSYAIQELAVQLGVDDIVTFIPHTPDPSEYFQDADCYVLPSRWEGSPLVLLEALSFGLPVLATDCRFGPSDIVTEIAIGRLVTVNDPTSLAAGLVEERFRSETMADRRARTARANEYSSEAAVNHHLAVLTEVLDENLAI